MKNPQKIKQAKRARRHARVRSKVNGTKERPRLNIYRSLTRTYAQLVDDTTGRVVAAASDAALAKSDGTKTERAHAVGKLIAKLAKKASVSKVVLDRDGYRYHGRVKALAEGAREGGLKF